MKLQFYLYQGIKVFFYYFITKINLKLIFFFIYSIVFLVIPVIFNFIFSITIIIKEIHRHDKLFYEWFKKYTNIASIFTIFGALDVETLNILHSKIAGFEQLNAPMSDEALRWILRAGLITFVIEEIPQFIIQVSIQYSSNFFFFYKFRLIIFFFNS